MKRNEFLKKLAVGAGVAIVAPILLKAETPIVSDNPVSLAIDMHSLMNITAGGRRLSAAEIIDLYHQTGILIYNSATGANPPIVFQGEVEVVDVAKIKKR